MSFGASKAKHGPVNCNYCFPAGSAPGCTVEFGGWRVANNPGYWGATEPEILVLGFSKGANQRSTLAFDQIAFHNARGNLAEILTALDMLAPDADINVCFSAAEKKLGFASVVRCGLGKEAEQSGKYATSGDVVRAAIAGGSPVRRFFDACTEQFLKVLPPSLRVVVFLGLDEPYVEAIFQRMSELHPNVRRVSDLAYATNSVTFVHVIHPSPLATSHRQAWLLNGSGGLADKRRRVRTALGKTDDNPQECSYAPQLKASSKHVRSGGLSARRASKPTAPSLTPSPPPTGLHALVSRGPHAGIVLRPHVQDGFHIVSPTKYKADYIFVPIDEPLEPYLTRGLKLRMSAPNIAPSLIMPASIRGRAIGT